MKEAQARVGGVILGLILMIAGGATALVLYGTRASPKHAALLKKLGKHSMAGGCLHLKALADVDVEVLDELIRSAVKARKAKK